MRFSLKENYLKSTSKSMDSATSRFSGELKTGIIFFSRSRNCEARSKKWHSSHAKNLKIAEHLINRTKSVLETTGHDVILIDETKQHGLTFGEKIRFAFEDAFALGYDQLILVGNDSVGLSNQYISESIDFLETNAYVFGSTVDNGLYLVGFNRSFFEKKSAQIANLPWRTHRLVDEFEKLTGFHGSTILPVLSDLNTVSDIERLLKSKLDIFTEIIRKIVHGVSEITHREAFSVVLNTEYAKVNQRGPPGFNLH